MHRHGGETPCKPQEPRNPVVYLNSCEEGVSFAAPRPARPIVHLSSDEEGWARHAGAKGEHQR